jgi:hypothetical protein
MSLKLWAVIPTTHLVMGTPNIYYLNDQSVMSNICVHALINYFPALFFSFWGDSLVFIFFYNAL